MRQCLQSVCEIKRAEGHPRLFFAVYNSIKLWYDGANRFEEHANGGGALKITKGASVNLEGCTFKKNTSADDGGAILNSGTVRSHNSTFGSNHAGYYGGAVMNRGLMHSRKDSFDTRRRRL